MRWEYKVSNAPTTPRELQAVLDHDGCAEWELVTATPFASRLILLFKRPLANAEEACEEMELAPEADAPAEEVPAESEVENQVESVIE